MEYKHFASAYYLTAIHSETTFSVAMIFRNNSMPASKLLSIISVFLIVLLTIGCSGSGTFTDTIAEHSRTAILEERKIEETKAYPEAIDLLGNSAAVFSFFGTKSIPLQSAEKLHKAVISRIEGLTFYQSILSDEQLNAMLEKNPGMAQGKEIYLDSLTVVSVSDKDLSNPLGRYLNVDNFLVFQLDRWPCLTCKDDNGIRMKLRLVDAKSSHIIWTGIAEKRKLDGEEAANVEALALNLAEQLADNFNNRFKKKWHRKRFENLAKSVS